MACLRAKLQNEKLNTLGRLKKTLQENLSLSSKLFLRRVLLSVSPRSLRPKPFSFETPTLPADFDLSSLVNSDKPPALHAAEIQTSIIIPVFNKANFTFQCLTSLIHEIDLGKNEIIVVDNASSDQTEAVLAHFENVVHTIRNEENRGFVDACNQGAAASRGKYLLFLNNDTVVLPGWLDHLVDTIEANPKHGAVGSLFLYPEGSIQEAGSIVWKNGEAHHYGWGASPDDHRFNFAREVDYCSAASLLIRREIFEQLGGFDRRFVPAYYEDVDLCFGVRSLGYKVIYQPMSRVVHYEGATAGTDTKKGAKQFQITNREKFVEKWYAVLDREHLPKDLKQLERASDRNRDRPRVIVFDERVPSPDRDAGSLRMFIILKTLLSWYRVIFVPFNRPQSLDYERALWKVGIQTADAVDYRRLLKDPTVKAAIVSRPTMGQVFIKQIRRAAPKVKIVFDMVDTHFLRLQREHEISRAAETLRESQRYRKLERKLARESDLVWCASSSDKEVMQREAPNTPIAVVTTIHQLHDPGAGFEERQGLLFIGNLAHRPNDDAVRFLLQNIYPLVQRSLPNVQLDIIGPYGAPSLSEYNSESVHIRGYVSDVEPYLRGRRVFVAPLRFGAGIKGKVGEALAHGLPVVTTSIGAEGFGLTNEFDVMIADDAESLAAAIIQVYAQKDLWERLAENSRLLIEKHFTPEVVAETINNSIKEDGQ